MKKVVEKIDRKIISVDAEGKPLGRLAVEVAILLRGKNKPSFVPYKDMGDVVLVKNIEKMKFTGNKLEGKEYLVNLYFVFLFIINQLVLFNKFI